MRVLPLFLMCLFLLPGLGTAASIEGQASVIDGDTLEIHGQRIRLHGIDAPESGQYCYAPSGKPWRCGQRAALELQDFIGNRPLSCERKAVDRYRRIVARCFAGGQDLGAWLVGNGWALAYERYSKAYVADETRARTAKAGIWQGTVEKPWEWRKKRYKVGKGEKQ